MERRAKVAYEIGALLVGDMRRYLEDAKFKYPDLVWSEGSGILSRVFYLRGPARLIKAIDKQIKELDRE